MGASNWPKLYLARYLLVTGQQILVARKRNGEYALNIQEAARRPLLIELMTWV